MNRKLLSNTILYTMGEAIPRVISFLMMPIFTRYLAPSDYGILSYTNSVITFIYALCSLGLNTYVLRFYFDCKSENEKKRLLGNVFVFITLVNVFVLVLINITGPLIIEKAQINVPWEPYFKLAILNNFLESFSIIPMIYYRVKQNAKSFVGVSVGRCVAQYLLTLIMLVNIGLGLISQYYARLFTLLPFFVLYVAIMLKNSTLCFDWKQIYSALKFSLPLLPGIISYLALTSFDRVILERYVSLEIIGIYNIAYTIASAINMVVQSFYRTLEPDIFNKYNESKESDYYLCYMKKINSIYNFALFVLACAISLFSKEVLIIIASESYSAATSYVPAVLVGVILSGTNLLIGCELTAEKRSVVNGISSMIGAGISVVLNLFLIPKIGVIAAPITLAISYFVMNMYLKYCTKIKFFNNWQELFAMLLFGVCSFISIVNFQIHQSIVILIKIIVYLVTMLLLAINFRIFIFVKEVRKS